MFRNLIRMRSPTLLLIVFLACSPTDCTTIRPEEGLWSFTGGDVLESDCPEGGPTFPLEYILTRTGETTFKLSPPESKERAPLHVCTMSGADFECPSVEIAGFGFISIAVGLSGTFTSETHATGVRTWTWHCGWIPTTTGSSSGGPSDGTSSGGPSDGTSSGGPSDPILDSQDCTDEIGDTCSMSQKLEAARVTK